ncbi:MAG: DMT family transporter [Anaerolineales bacterium]|nr:DMT family transporter [Anaerolineales bacterium]MCO5246215.1 DMT family transporter [Anaerolineae bacterium]
MTRHSTDARYLVAVRWLKLAAVLTLWALSFVLNEVALDFVTPTTVAAGRWVVTATLALALLAHRRQTGEFRRALRVDFRGFALLSLVGVTLLYGLQIVGQSRTTAINAGLLANTVPVFTALLAVTTLHQRIRPVGWLGIAVALVGAWIVSSGGLRLDVTTSSALGDLLVLLSALAAALYFVLGARLLRGYPPLVVTAAAATLGAATLAILAVVAGGENHWTWQAVVAIVALGVGPGLLSNLWWWETVTWLDASRAALYVYLIPLITMVFAVVLLGETIGLAQLAGAALLLGGVWLAERGQAPT